MHSLTTSRVCESLDFHGYAETGQTSVSIPLPRMPTHPLTPTQLSPWQGRLGMGTVAFRPCFGLTCAKSF